MPEGPEVRIVTEYLNQFLDDATLLTLIPIKRDYAKKHIRGDFRECRRELPLKILEVRCKGKFIWFELEEEWFIFHNLGMTGNWLYHHTVHTHFEINTDYGSLYYQDVRRFGGFRFVRGKDELERKLNTLGPDMLNGTKSQEFLQRMNRNPGRTISQQLMDQSVVTYT